MAKEETKKRHYDADDIVVLEGLEPVRKRPGMYIGSTGPDGLHHLMVEIFDNSRDEAMNGSCNEIEVALLPGEVVRVADNGAGIPVATHSKTKVSALETVMTVLHAGGKFEGDGYKISGGLHGVGACRGKRGPFLSSFTCLPYQSSVLGVGSAEPSLL
jgi:DNA gyrase subunit B